MKPKTIGTGEYRVTSDKVELPRGTYFYVIPGPVEFGQLAMFEIDGFLLTGRWCPDVAGNDWIMVPDYRIRISGEVSVRIVGLVIPSELPPKQITDLPADEYERFFENLLQRTLDG
jgi:hypothetical protein